MSKLMKKLKNKRGESLVESLCAILIFTMASIVMFSMVSAAGDINTKAKAMDAKNQQDMVAMEIGDPDARNGQAIITFTFADSSINEQIVDVYGGKNDTLYAYFYALEEEAGG